MTGHAFVKDFFLKGATDVEKQRTFTMNKHCWREVREEGKAWIEDNLARWEDEEPEWLAPLLAGLDDDMLPEDWVEDVVSTRGSRVRRQNSLSSMMRSSASSVGEIEGGKYKRGFLFKGREGGRGGGRGGGGGGQGAKVVPGGPDSTPVME
jgi:hypothetical protein